ncbi:alpha/beta hydrolase family protein [Paenibacillus tarimensis]|uniref:hypothetical protein n=1 Tax=Paenibacillus tarimensis TaxID=416012 RepID=UPI001F1E65F3|nr:hypothetical protein [Paenibacillus tarimensis]MCF2943612.1 hypothetical protein [Paenibacillus tarimensis]
MTMDRTDHDHLDIYLLAGVATRPGFFADCQQILDRLCRSSWEEVRIQVVYPYGDYTRSLLRQIHEVRQDLFRRNRLRRPGGGQAAAEPVRLTSAGRSVLLIGHSGGGVAAYHAGKMLLEEGIVSDCRMVQVGAPKVRIEPAYRDKVSYFYAVDGSGKVNDPVTRIGSWGGFRTGRYGVPVWDALRYAPGHIGSIQVVGGHADYFRARPPFIKDQVSNLQRTLGSVWEWMQEFARSPDYSS